MASFNIFYPLLSELEGGYQNLTSDPGNRNSLGVYVGTNWGISARFYEDILGHPPTVQEMKNLSKDEAKQIYKTHFWNKLRASQINNQAVANTIVDMQVNSGRGGRIAQEVLRDRFNINISVDGIVGPKTIFAINSVNANQFVVKYNEARVAYYKQIGNASFINGWLNRVKRFAVENTGTISLFGVLFLTGIGLLIIKNIN